MSEPAGSDHLDMLADAYRKVRSHYLDPVTPASLSMNAIHAMQEFAISKNSGLQRPAKEALENVDDEAVLKVIGNVFDSYAQDAKVDRKLLEQAAIKGMITSLDRHSAFMTPEMYHEMQVETKGQFGGIGLQIGLKENRIVVIAPIEGSPAHRAGIKAGDFITTINGESTQALTLFEAVNRLRGPLGSKMTIGLERSGEPTMLSFEFARESVIINSVQSKIIDDKFGYVKISQFQEATPKHLAAALQTFKRQGVQACILDLRNNPGGLFTAAVETAELFLGGTNKLVVYTKGREGKKDDWFALAKRGHFHDMPLVILVNNGTAAGAEILAGALQDYSRAKVIGTTTFGNGTVQTIIPIKGGAGLRLTTSRSFTPRGRPIQAAIQPDLVAAEQEGSDAILSSALAELTNKLHE